MRPVGTEFDPDPYLTHLEALPFVEVARLTGMGRLPGNRAADATLELKVRGKPYRLLVEYKAAAPLNHALVDAMLARARHTLGKDWILFTPRITAPIGRYLQQHRANYVDAAGNCNLVLDENLMAIVEGRRPAVPLIAPRAMGPAGYRVLFAILARPDLLNATVRALAAQAGVGKTHAATLLTRLRREDAVARTRAHKVLTRPAALLERWIAGYVDILRPKLALGTYASPERDPIAVEKCIGDDLAQEEARQVEGGAIVDHGLRWAWGGAAAAHRLTGHYRGERTVLHVETWPANRVRRLRLLPARGGPVLVLRAAAPIAFDGAIPRTAHPLLVYAELLAEQNERAREAAGEVRKRYLAHLE